MKTGLTLAALLLTGLAPLAAHADGFPLSITFAPAQPVQPGSTTTFSGTLTNTGTATLFLNDATFDGSAPGFTFDDTAFFSGAPTSLAGGASYGVADLFTVTPDPNLKPGQYTGVFTILGGTGANDSNPIGSQPFGIQVVPEASTAVSLGLLVLGAGALAFRGRRRVMAAA